MHRHAPTLVGANYSCSTVSNLASLIGLLISIAERGPDTKTHARIMSACISETTSL